MAQYMTGLDWQVPFAATADGRILAANEEWKPDGSGSADLYHSSFFLTDLTGTDHLPLTRDIVILTQDSQAPICESGFEQIDTQQGTEFLPC